MLRHIKFSLEKYLTHLEFVHQGHANFSISCGLYGCPHTYTIIKSLRTHMRIKHADIYNSRSLIKNTININIQVPSADPLSDVEYGDELEEGDFDMLENSNDSIEVIKEKFTMNDFLLALQKHFAMFVLQKGEKHAIPTVVQHDIANEVRSFFMYFSTNHNTFLKHHLKKLGFEVDADGDLRELFDTEDLVDKALSSVSSQSKILQFCKAHLHYVEPRMMSLKIPKQTPAAANNNNLPESNSDSDSDDLVVTNDNNTTEGVANSNDQTEKAHKTTFQYITILDVIQGFIKQKGVWNSIQRKVQADSLKDPALLTSYADGSNCKHMQCLAKINLLCACIYISMNLRCVTQLVHIEQHTNYALFTFLLVI